MAVEEEPGQAPPESETVEDPRADEGPFPAHEESGSSGNRGGSRSRGGGVGKLDLGDDESATAGSPSKEGSQGQLKLDSPRVMEACRRQGVEPSDLEFKPLESFAESGLPISVQQMRYQSNEKQRVEWKRAVTKDYTSILKKSNKKQPRRSTSQRSQASSSRSLTGAAVASREKKALENYEKILAITTQKNLETEMKAAQVEAVRRHREDRFNSRSKKMSEDRRDEAMCKDTWRKSKYDAAQQVAALQLEHHAHQVVEKERQRLHALKDREMRYNNQSEIRRMEHTRRAQSVATTLQEQETLREEMEQNRESADQERQNAYMESLNKQREDLALRGKQKQIEIMRKVHRVREMEDQKVRQYMKHSEDKMSQFLHIQLEKQRHEEAVKAERRSSNKKNAERRQQVMAQAEQRKEELLKRMADSEETNRRAAEKKAEEEALRIAKHELRQQEIAKSQERLRKMEEYRLNCLVSKVERTDNRIKSMQDQKQKEMELVRRIKQDSFLKQRELQAQAEKGQRLKKKRLVQALEEQLKAERL